MRVTVDDEFCCLFKTKVDNIFIRAQCYWGIKHSKNKTLQVVEDIDERDADADAEGVLEYNVDSTVAQSSLQLYG